MISGNIARKVLICITALAIMFALGSINIKFIGGVDISPDQAVAKWPWDGIVGTISKTISNAKTSISNAVSSVAAPAAKAQQSSSGQSSSNNSGGNSSFASSVASGIKNVASSVTKAVSNAVSTVSSSISKGISSIGSAVASVAASTFNVAGSIGSVAYSLSKQAATTAQKPGFAINLVMQGGQIALTALAYTSGPFGSATYAASIVIGTPGIVAAAKAVVGQVKDAIFGKKESETPAARNNETASQATKASANVFTKTEASSNAGTSASIGNTQANTYIRQEQNEKGNNSLSQSGTNSTGSQETSVVNTTFNSGASNSGTSASSVQTSGGAPPDGTAVNAPLVATVNTSSGFSQDNGGAMSSSEYMKMFFENPSDPRLTLYIPGYAYFQGLIYSQGNVTAAGPVRIIGGVVAASGKITGSGSKIQLQKGAMITTDPEYLKAVGDSSATNLRIVEWKEVPPQ